MLTLYEEEVRRRRIRKRLCSAVRLYAQAQSKFYIVFLCNGIHNIPLLSAVTEKRVSVPEAHKNVYNKKRYYEDIDEDKIDRNDTEELLNKEYLLINDEDNHKDNDEKCCIKLNIKDIKKEQFMKILKQLLNNRTKKIYLT